MATGNKSANNKKNTRDAKKSSSSKKASNSKRAGSAQGRSREDFTADLIKTIAFDGVMIFVFFCTIGLCGRLGGWISNALFACFGAMAYILPILAGLVAVMLLYDDYSGYMIRKSSFIGVLLLVLCALSHAVVHIDWGFKELMDAVKYSVENKSAGGFFGTLFIGMLYPLLSKSGTWIVLIVAIIVLIMLIAGNAIIDLAKYIISCYHMDEEEILARQAVKEKRAKRAEIIKEDRKKERMMRYEEEKVKEEEEISDLERRRAMRQASPEIRPIVLGGDASPSQVGGVLTDSAAFSEANADKGNVLRDEPMKDNKSNVTVSEGGELHFSGDVSDSKAHISEESDKAAGILMDAAFRGGDVKEHIDDASLFSDADVVDATIDKKVVKNEVADFSDVVDEPKMNISGSDIVEDEIDEPAIEEPKKRKRKHTKESAKETEIAVNETAKEISSSSSNGSKKKYERPPITLLGKGNPAKGTTKGELQATAKKLEETLDSFGVHVTVTDVSCGPAVTRYEMQPEQGTRVNKITGLADDIKLAMAVADIRIEAPIPGKSAVGIEIPNKEAAAVAFRDLLEGSDFLDRKGDLLFAVGKDISGEIVISDIGKMPHVLIAGATGSGKSVCINTLIMSIIYKADPNDVKLIMIDPKVVELSVYNGIPHLLIPVVTDPKKASGALNWAVAEMDARYKKFAKYGVRGLEGYNQKVDAIHAKGEDPEGEFERMPKIVIIVDELADLMMVAKGEVEDAIVRLTQLARAAGIHLVIATQRPSVDVITGLIKANVPSRIAFAVSSGVDSRTIIDTVGAEKLLGKGDMLFHPRDLAKPIRVQGAFVSDREVAAVVECIKAQEIDAGYNDSIEKEINQGPQNIRDANKEMDRDEYFNDAARFIIEKQKASIGMLQRVYKIGFNRAARIMDQLSEAGVVGPEEGTKARTILMTMDDFDEFLNSQMEE